MACLGLAADFALDAAVSYLETFRWCCGVCRFCFGWGNCVFNNLQMGWWGKLVLDWVLLLFWVGGVLLDLIIFRFDGWVDLSLVGCCFCLAWGSFRYNNLEMGW